jgi:hypothetical protein
MERGRVVYWGVGISVLILLVFFAVGFSGDKAMVEGNVVQSPVSEPVPVPIVVPVSPKVDDGIVDFDKYNYDFVDENVKGILNGILGASGKTAFYLPAVGYVNVSRGSKYGVAFALNNLNPAGAGVDWEQYNDFEYDWNVDPSVVRDCGVSVVEAQKWIERGWSSWGKMAHGWVDHMTIYFSFPSDIEPCSVAYDFVVMKDGVAYDSKKVLFNLG